MEDQCPDLESNVDESPDSLGTFDADRFWDIVRSAIGRIWELPCLYAVKLLVTSLFALVLVLVLVVVVSVVATGGAAAAFSPMLECHGLVCYPSLGMLSGFGYLFQLGFWRNEW